MTLHQYVSVDKTKIHCISKANGESVSHMKMLKMYKMLCYVN